MFADARPGDGRYARPWPQAISCTLVRLVVVDSASRARVLLEHGEPLESVVRELRADGFDLLASLSGLIKAGVSYDEARSTVVDGPVWADQRDKVTTNQWVDPPERPDQKSVERLRAACGQVARIAELWVTGSEMTRRDGSSEVSTTLAIVLDPPATDLLEEKETAATVEIATRLDTAWLPTGRRSWVWVSREMIAGERMSKHCVAVYSRP